MGWIGSPVSVLAASAVDGAIMSLFNKGHAERGRQLLASLAPVRATMLKRALLVPIDRLSGIELPDPAAWSASYDEAVVRTIQGFFSDKQEKTVETRRYVSDGEPFLRVVAEEGQLLVAWGQLVAYQPHCLVE